MTPPSPQDVLESVRRGVFQDIGLKLASLAAALVLFSVVHGAEDAQKSVYVDLITLLPTEDSGRMLVSDVPVRVRVTLTGSRSQLNSIRQEQLAPVQIDLRGHRGDEYYFSDEDLDLPVGVEIAQWEPASIPLEYAVRAERAVSVAPQFEPDLPEGLSFGRVVSVVPSMVRLSGPEDEIDSVHEIPTDPISLSRFGAGEHQVRARLVRPPERADYGDRTSALVRFTVEAERRDRRFQDLTVAALGGEVRSIRPMRVDVRLHGSPAQIDAIDADHLIPYVDVSELGHVRGGVPVRVQVRGVPEGAEVQSIEPAEVIVTPGG